MLIGRAVLIDGERNGVLGEPCSGVLIAPRVVLTAARCVSEADRFRVRAPFAYGYGGDAWGRWARSTPAGTVTRTATRPAASPWCSSIGPSI